MCFAGNKRRSDVPYRLAFPGEFLRGFDCSLLRPCELIHANASKSSVNHVHGHANLQWIREVISLQLTPKRKSTATLIEAAWARKHIPLLGDEGNSFCRHFAVITDMALPRFAIWCKVQSVNLMMMVLYSGSNKLFILGVILFRLFTPSAFGSIVCG